MCCIQYNYEMDFKQRNYLNSKKGFFKSLKCQKKQKEMLFALVDHRQKKEFHGFLFMQGGKIRIMGVVKGRIGKKNNRCTQM